MVVLGGGSGGGGGGTTTKAVTEWSGSFCILRISTTCIFVDVVLRAWIWKLGSTRVEGLAGVLGRADTFTCNLQHFPAPESRPIALRSTVRFGTDMVLFYSQVLKRCQY